MSTYYLLATDGSSVSDRALESLLNHASSQDNVDVVHVIPDTSGFLLGTDYEPAIEEAKLRNFAEKITNTAVDKLSEHSVKANAVIRTGHAGEELCALAKKNEVDFIVIGRRGTGQIDEFLLGSVTQYVIHHAPCPVMAVPED